MVPVSCFVCMNRSSQSYHRCLFRDSLCDSVCRHLSVYLVAAKPHLITRGQVTSTTNLLLVAQVVPLLWATGRAQFKF